MINNFSRNAEKIAEIVVKAYREGKRQNVSRVKIVQEVLEIADRSWKESTFCRDDSRGDTHSDRVRQRRRYDPEEAAIIARGETVCPVEIQGISFGETAIVTNPAELFVAFGIEIRERSPFEVTLISELTNGYCGYVPTEKGFEEQGYETHRSVYTSRLEKGGGRRIVEASVEILERLNSGRRQRQMDRPL